MNDDEEVGGDIGDVYYCTWDKTKEGKYAGWEKKHPFLRVEVASKKDLLPELGNVVGEHYSDFEAAIHFDPSLEINDDSRHLFIDDLIEVGWNDTFTFRPSRESAFAGGRCNQCGSGIGARTASPLVVDSTVEGDGAFSSCTFGPPPGNGDPGWLNIVSDAFLRLLTKDERAQFEARPIQWETKSTRRFFEVKPKKFVPEVAIKGMELNGWRCDWCGLHNFSHGKMLGWTVNVICRSDLSSALPECFFIGSPTQVRLYTTGKRWRELCGKPGTRKLGGGPLAVVDEESCERHPWLPTRNELEQFRSRHDLYKWAMIVATGEPGMLRGYSKDMQSYIDGTSR